MEQTRSAPGPKAPHLKAPLASKTTLAERLGDVKGGLVASTTCLGFSIANGAFIYSAVTEAPMLVKGIVAGLVTTTVAACVLALTSSFRPVIGTANAVATAPLIAIVGSAAPAINAMAKMNEPEAFATAYTLVGVATLVAGLFLLVLGFGRFGNVVRYVPFPVVAGFMGELGTLLVLGATRFSTGVKVELASLKQFLGWKPMIFLIVTIAFATLITLATKRFKHPLVLPGLLLGAVLATNAVVYAFGGSIDSAAVKGLFLAPRALLEPSGLPLLTAPPTAAHWDVIWDHAPGIAAYALLVTLATLLTSTGLETALGVDADYDRELRAQGMTNVACALAGGFTGNPSVGSTMAGVNSGARSRVAGITNSIVMLIVIAFGLRFLPYIPRFVVAGLLMQVGATIVFNNCVKTRTKMPLGEWLIVLAIVVITVKYGLVPAIVVGLIGGCILFALDVSRIDVVRRHYGLDCRTSPVVHSKAELEVLAGQGRKVQFLELTGTLFFGSAHNVLERARAIIADSRPTTIVLDLTAVTGSDSTTAAVFARMRKILAKENVGLAVAGGRPEVVALLRSAGGLMKDDPVYATRNEALEASEIAVLTEAGAVAVPKPLEEWLGSTLGDPALAKTLAPDLDLVHYSKGSYLCRAGDPTDTLLFIESGRVGVMVGPPDAEVCVRVFGPQAIAGEHGFVLQLPRTASLKAEADTVVRVLARRTFDRLAAEEPRLAIALLRDIVGLQSERLAFATRQAALLN